MLPVPETGVLPLDESATGHTSTNHDNRCGRGVGSSDLTGERRWYTSRLTSSGHARVERCMGDAIKRNRLTNAASYVYHWSMGVTNYGMTLNQKGGRNDSPNSWGDSCDCNCGGGDGVDTGGGAYFWF